MEKIYSPYSGEVLTTETMNSINRNNGEINRIINEIINVKSNGKSSNEIAGSDQIISNILNAYVHMIIRLDSSFSSLIISDLEKWISSRLEIEYNNNTLVIKTGGIIDRIDITGDTHRIIDYKTGNIDMEIDSVESLFDESDDRRNEAWFQILMYCELFARENPGVKVRPSLYAVRNLNEKDFSDYLVLKKRKTEKIFVSDYSEIRSEFSSGLKSTLESLFNKDEPFIMTEHRRKCDICPYRQLCQR